MSRSASPAFRTSFSESSSSWTPPFAVTKSRGGVSEVSWFSDSFHSSFRESAWSVADADPARVRNNNPKSVHAGFAGSLRSSPASVRRRSTSARTRRPGSSSSMISEDRSVVPRATDAASRATARAASPRARRPPKFAPEGSPDASPGAGRGKAHENRPEWNVPAFKGNVGRLHVSQRARIGSEMRAEQKLDEISRSFE